MYNEKRQKEIRELKEEIASLQRNKKLIEEKITEYRERITVLMMKEMLAGTSEYIESEAKERQNVR